MEIKTWPTYNLLRTVSSLPRGDSLLSKFMWDTEYILVKFNNFAGCIWKRIGFARALNDSQSEWELEKKKQIN